MLLSVINLRDSGKFGFYCVVFDYDVGEWEICVHCDIRLFRLYNTTTDRPPLMFCEELSF